MSRPITLWIHALCDRAGYGGWAYVLDEGGRHSGAAGGARGVTAEAMLGAALGQALPKAGTTRPLTVRSNLVPEAPAAGLSFIRADHPFLKAWADEGQKQGKTRGTFSAAIPKPNFKGFKPAP
jgi:hypothetical protein